MHRFEIKGTGRPSVILVGEKIENIDRYLPAGRTVVITDANVRQLYGDRFPEAPVLSIGSGEAAKTLETAKDLYETLLSLGADRSTFILGVGGGIVCDVTGFVASTYMRGLRFGFVATTLLAQVDASVGGKNGVNLEGYKNLVGTFNQPEFVLCDLELLQTLPEAEVVNGMAEIVKHALIADAGLFAFLEGHVLQALSLDREAAERLVRDSVVIKSGVVARDERETGERRKLNFGHTFGHALEKVSGMTHGEAVSVGMVLAAAVSVRKGRLAAASFDRMIRLLRSLRLPCRAVADLRRVVEAVLRDKKREADTLHFVMLDDIGQAVVEPIPIAELKQLAVGFDDILTRS
ncbi:MAG: 3-dehydroquinate synthase [Hyphomicrobiales bacterium]